MRCRRAGRCGLALEDPLERDSERTGFIEAPLIGAARRPASATYPLTVTRLGEETTPLVHRIQEVRSHLLLNHPLLLRCVVPAFRRVPQARGDSSAIDRLALDDQRAEHCLRIGIALCPVSTARERIA